MGAQETWDLGWGEGWGWDFALWGPTSLAAINTHSSPVVQYYSPLGAIALWVKDLVGIYVGHCVGMCLCVFIFLCVF